MYVGWYWGADVHEEYLWLPSPACPNRRGILGYGQHSPS